MNTITIYRTESQVSNKFKFIGEKYLPQLHNNKQHSVRAHRKWKIYASFLYVKEQRMKNADTTKRVQEKRKVLDGILNRTATAQSLQIKISI